MFFKVGIKVLFIAGEIFLGFYSLLMSDSLLVKFLFFAVTAIIVAFSVIKLVNKVLPVDKDYISLEQEEEDLDLR